MEYIWNHGIRSLARNDLQTNYNTLRALDSRWLLSESTSVSIHADRLIYWRSLWWSTSGTRSDVCVRVLRTKLLNQMNPKIWNSLPQLLESVPALTLFCRNLETHYFHKPSFLCLVFTFCCAFINIYSLIYDLLTLKVQKIISGETNKFRLKNHVWWTAMIELQHMNFRGRSSLLW